MIKLKDAEGTLHDTLVFAAVRCRQVEGLGKDCSSLSDFRDFEGNYRRKTFGGKKIWWFLPRWTQVMGFWETVETAQKCQDLGNCAGS